MGRAAGDRRQQAWSHSGGTGCCWRRHRSPAWAQPSQAAGHPPELRAPLGVGQGVLQAQSVRGRGRRGTRATAEDVLPSLIAGLCCLQDSGRVAVPPAPAPRSSERWPHAAGPCFIGCVLWCSCTPRASGRRFARVWPGPTATGTKGMRCRAARSSRPALPKSLPRDPGSMSQLWGDRRGLGVHIGRGVHSLAVPGDLGAPWGWQDTSKAASGWGWPEAEPGAQGAHWGAPWGNACVQSFKVQPCCQRGSKGHWRPGNCLVSHAGAVPAAGWATAAPAEPCQPLRPGQRGEKPAQPMAAPSPAGCPGAPAHPPAPVCTAGTGRAPREALGSCLQSTW